MLLINKIVSIFVICKLFFVIKIEGASPVDTSHIAAQPPPPGVGPLLPPNVSSEQPSYNNQRYEPEDIHKDSKKIDDRYGEIFKSWLKKF